MSLFNQPMRTGATTRPSPAEARLASTRTDRMLDINTHSAQETFAVGEQLGRLLGPGDVVCLQGDLGSGKTCLTQGIGQGLGVEGTINSPTFVFINEHRARQPGPYLYHVDLYRINDLLDALVLGLEDYMYGDGITVIEWAERARELIPEDRLWITLQYVGPSERKLLFVATGAHYEELVRELDDALHLTIPGSGEQSH